jgi:ferredoxin
MRLIFWRVVQPDEVHEGCQYLVLEANSCPADAVTAIEDQLMQVFNAILMTPKHVDGTGDARVMFADDRHLVVNLELPWQFMKRHGPRGLIRLIVDEFWKATVFTVAHVFCYSRCARTVWLACPQNAIFHGREPAG